MSYELGAARRTVGRYKLAPRPVRRPQIGARRPARFRRPVGRLAAPSSSAVDVMLRRATPASLTLARSRVRGMLPVTYTDLNGCPVNDGEVGLGFSLKPPKFIRKAARFVKKNVTLKRALIAGAVVAGAVVAGPALLAAGKAVAKGAGGLARGAGGLIRGGAKAAGGVFRGGVKVVGTTQTPYGPIPMFEETPSLAARLARGLLGPGSNTAPPDGIPIDMGPQPNPPPMVESGGPHSPAEAAYMAAQAARANQLDYFDENDPGPMRTVMQNGEPVEVSATTASTNGKGGPAPAVSPAAIGIGLLLLGLAVRPKRAH